MGEEEVRENQEPENKPESADEDLAAQWAAMLENQQQDQQDLAAQWESMIEEKKEETPVPQDIPSAPQPAVSADSQLAKKLDLILDIPVTISFEVGSKKLSIEDIVKLSPSSIIELDRYIDQPIDIKVNGVLVAKGELYQVEDSFAVKITRIISKEDRIKLITSQLGGG